MKRCNILLGHIRHIAPAVATGIVIAVISWPLLQGDHAHASEVRAKSIAPKKVTRPKNEHGPPRKRAGQAAATSKPAVARTSRVLGKVNLNSADLASLIQLPGIGPAKAKRIIVWRMKRGPFKRIVDLRRVRGFGRKSVARLAPFLTLTAPSTLRTVRGE